jgi:hypothetical protein
MPKEIFRDLPSEGNLETQACKANRDIQYRAS